MHISRRELLRAGVASGALLVARPGRALGGLLGDSADAASAASRQSKLTSSSGLQLVHADLHNHSLLSDGDGQAAEAFASMRRAGLDVAALTDHAGVGKLLGATCKGCEHAIGIDESEWQHMGTLADLANEDGGFVAIRGFEWSSPTLGHVNVWFSTTWADPLVTGGVGLSTAAAFLQHEGGDDVPMTAEQRAAANDLYRAVPDSEVSMRGFYDWLAADTGRPVVGGGEDALGGFNHPGREGGRFGFFQYDARLRDRIVSIELFNRGEDYLFEQVDGGASSPLVECLDAGWRVGALGVTDEHGTNWGFPEGKGRTGVWATGLTRPEVRAGMASRRFFATREKGLRLDAAAAGVPMGGMVTHGNGPLAFELDIAKGAEWTGKTLLVQVLQTGRPLPTVIAEREVVVPADDAAPLAFEVPVDRSNGDWVLLRVTDPSRGADSRAQPFEAYRSAGRAVAYASPFHLA